MKRPEDSSRGSLRSRRRSLVLVGAAVAFAATAAAAWALPPFTKGAKASPAGPNGPAIVYQLSVSCGASYDRVVLRARRATPGYRVRFVSQITQDASGLPVRLLGSAKLSVALPSAQAHTFDGATAYLPAVVAPRCANLRQVKKVGDFEGIVSLGPGLDHKAGFRVFRLTNPTRVVIDIAH